MLTAPVRLGYRPKIKFPVQASQRPLWPYTRWLSVRSDF